MDRLIEIAAGQRLSVRDLIQAFGDRSLGALLVLPCLLVILPIGMIPGVPDVAALLMILIGAQMIAGMERLWLPSRLERVSFEGSRLIGGLQRARPWAVRIDGAIGKRFAWFAESRFASKTVGAVTILASLVILIIGIIPGLPALISLPVLLFGLGILAKNGLLILTGYILCGIVAWLAALLL